MSAYGTEVNHIKRLFCIVSGLVPFSDDLSSLFASSFASWALLHMQEDVNHGIRLQKIALAETMAAES